MWAMCMFALRPGDEDSAALLQSSSCCAAAAGMVAGMGCRVCAGGKGEIQAWAWMHGQKQSTQLGNVRNESCNLASLI